MGGVRALAEAFAARLRGMILLNAPVSRIAHDGARASVTLANGRVYAGDEVVLATPPSVWGKMRIEPGLPPELRPRTGAASKLFAIAPGPFWARSGASSTALTDTDVPWIWASTLGQTSVNEDPREVVCGFTAGSMSARLSAATRPERDGVLLGALGALHAGHAQDIQTVRYLNWSAEEWSLGGYSFPAPGEVTTIGKALREVRGSLRLAGEHCSSAFVGSMEGALESGVRAAEGILAGVRGAAR